MKKKIGELIFQIIPVMIGVYLGFVASNWSQSNQRKSESKIMVSNILSEIESNQKRLENAIDYHTILRDSSRFYSNTIGGLKSRPQYFRGTRLTKLANSAYMTGTQTGIINELPLEKIQRLNNLYTFQDDYNEFGTLIMSSLINKDFSGKGEGLNEIVRFLSVTMTDIVIKESDLIEGYNATRVMLNKQR